MKLEIKSEKISIYVIWDWVYFEGSNHENNDWYKLIKNAF